MTTQATVAVGSTTLFSHFLVIRAQESLPPTPITPQVTYHYRAPNAIDFPPATPEFAYPDATLIEKYDTDGYGCEVFIFVLTADSGERLYGYTRRFLPVGNLPRYPEALSLLSSIFAPALFLELLEHAHTRWLLQPGAMFTLLDNCVRSKIPPPGSLYALEWSNATEAGVIPGGIRHTERLILARPDPSFAPSCQLMPLIRGSIGALSLDNLMLLFSALICEQRIIMTSRRLERLSNCVHATVALLSPLEWQHILIPLLPPALLNYCLAPMPYLVGMREEYIDELLALSGVEGESIILVDLDSNRISRLNDRYTQIVPIVANGNEEHQPMSSSLFNFPLPEELGFKLRKHLKSKWSDLTDQDFHEAFQTFWFGLFGHVRVWNEPKLFDSKGRFDMDRFVEYSEELVPHLTEFLKLIVHSQCIERFCEERATAAALTNPHASLIDGPTLTPAQRFERIRSEIFIAAAQDDPQKPLLALRSFSFILKRLHQHNEAVAALTSAATSAQLASAPSMDPHAIIFPGAAEVRKLALDVTSNSPLPAKRGHVRDLYDQLSKLSFDTRACDLIMSVVWERLTDCKKGDHAHGSKGLLLLEHLLQYGSDRIICQTLFTAQAQKVLQHLAYTYTHETDRIAEGIHAIALRIHALLNNIFLLRKTRKYVRVMDLRRFRYYGSTIKKKKDTDANSPTSADPEYDEYRVKSLVEMMVPAFPNFETLHQAYRAEFDRPATLPTPANIRRTSLTKSPSTGFGASPSAPPSASSANNEPSFNSQFDFAAFDAGWNGASAGAGTGASGASAPMSQSPPAAQPQFRAIMPPTDPNALPPSAKSTPVSSPSRPVSTRPMTQPPTASIIDTSVFGGVPAPIPLSARPTPQTSPALPTAATKQPSASIGSGPSAVINGSPSQPKRDVSKTTVVSTSATASVAPNAKASPTPTQQPVAASSLHPSVPPSKPITAPPSATTSARTSAHSSPALTPAASPWAAFDDAFAQPAPAVPLGQPNTTLKAIEPPKTIVAPPVVVDPTAGLDLFFSAPAATHSVEGEKKKKKKKDSKESQP